MHEKFDKRYPVTAAIHFLRDREIAIEPYTFEYEERGGTGVSSRELGISESIVIKTLIMEDEHKNPLVILMHGDKQVSLKELARQIGTKTIVPCKPEVASRHSGYQIGGTSPFGLRKVMPVYLEKSILELSEIYINGGSRGFLVKINPQEIIRTLNAIPVSVATTKSSAEKSR